MKAVMRGRIHSPSSRAPGRTGGRRARRQLRSLKKAVDVRFGSKADITSPLIHVRFTPKSGHCSARRHCPRAFVPEVDPPITGMMSETCGVYANEATGLLPRARVVLRNRARGSRQLIVAQSADDILDWVVDPGVRDVIAMRHVG